MEDPDETAGQIGIYRAIINDILDTARNAANRAGERFQGTSVIFLFEDVRKAITTFRHDDPAMKRLGNAAFPSTVTKA